MSRAEALRLSVVLPLRAASRQAANTLSSLSAPYQDTPPGSIEIVLVEARSPDMLGEERARRHGENVRYFEVDDGPGARTRSVSLGLLESRAASVGLFMDAAHLVTPRALDTALRALALDDAALVVLPEYRFDGARVPEAGRVETEQAFLENRNWRKDPYGLFSIARFGPANPNGCLSPLLGAVGLFAPKRLFAALGALDDRLDLPGAAALKLSLYTELARLPKTRLVVLPGEGAFRQHHPELDTPAVADEEANMEKLLFSAVFRIPGFKAVHREPLAFGTVPGPTLPFFTESAALAEYHCAACRKRGELPWYTD